MSFWKRFGQQEKRLGAVLLLAGFLAGIACVCFFPGLFVQNPGFLDTDTLSGISEWNINRTGLFLYCLQKRLGTALLLVLLYLFGPHILMRKIGFFGGIGFFLVFLLSNLFAYQQKQALDNRKGAIIISPSVNIKKTPAKTSTDQFVLHEGTRVDIIDKGITDWRGIRVGDGREGWIETKHLEEI